MSKIIKPQNITAEDMKHAQVLWDFCNITDDVDMTNDNHKSDYIIALGSLHMKEVAERCAELYEHGLAPKIISSGGVKRTHAIAGNRVYDFEADIMTHYMKAAGVPEEDIINERLSKHTGGNYLRSDTIIRTIDPTNKTPKIIAVSRPFVAIRAYLTAPAQTPHFRARLTTFRAEFNQFMKQQNHDEKIHIIEQMMGTINRVSDYPYLKLQIYKAVPENVRLSLESLVSRGYEADYLRKPKLIARDRLRSPKPTKLTP